MPRTSTVLLALASLAGPAFAQSTLGPTQPTGYPQDGYPQQYQQQYAPQQGYPQQYSQGYPQQGYADPNAQGYAAQPYDATGGQVIQVPPSRPQVYQQAPVQTDNEMVVPYAYPPAIGYPVPYPYPVGVGIGFGFGYPGYVYRGYPYYRGYIGRPGFYGGYRGGYVGGGYRGGYAHFGGGRGGRR